MNIKEIEELLGKYYEGNTTLAEEKLLKKFFSRDDVPVHLRDHQPMFRFFAEESAQTLSDERQNETLIRKIEEYREETSAVKTHPGKRRLYYLSGIAAGLLILMSLFFVIRNEVSRKQFKDSVNPSAELAYIQTRQALLMVSAGLNTGLDAAQRFKTLDNAIEQIQKFNKLYSYQSQYINPDRIQYPSTNK